MSGPGAVVRACAVLGVVAGLCGAVFMSLAGEPWVDDAIAIEEQAAVDDHHSGDGAEPEIVSRSDQRGIGLFSAYAASGAAFGLLFAAAFLALGRHSDRPLFGRALVAGAALAGAITVVPWLKYPPNPPAVGDPDTLSERQWSYLAAVALSAVVLFAAAHLADRLRHAGWPPPRRLAAVSAGVAVALGAIMLALPASPDQVPVPANLVWHFRLASLGGNLLLWAVLTGGFALYAAERERTAVTTG